MNEGLGSILLFKIICPMSHTMGPRHTHRVPILEGVGNTEPHVDIALIGLLQTCCKTIASTTKL